MGGVFQGKDTRAEKKETTVVRVSTVDAPRNIRGALEVALARTFVANLTGARTRIGADRGNNGCGSKV